MRTIVDWNHPEDDIVDAPSTEGFRERLVNSQSCSYQGSCALSHPLCYIPVVFSRDTDTDRSYSGLLTIERDYSLMVIVYIAYM